MLDYVQDLTGMSMPSLSLGTDRSARSISPATGPAPKNDLDPSGYSFWLLVAIAGAVGLASVSGSIRVGPVKASASVG